jgi:hypothetical protein
MMTENGREDEIFNHRKKKRCMDRQIQRSVVNTRRQDFERKAMEARDSE